MTDKDCILYVDDEENNLNSFRAYFRKEYTVFTASNAVDALEILENNHIPVIISDQRMPNITGIEFLEKTIEKYPDHLRILITAYADMGLVIEAINRGQINKFIQKPWDWEELSLSIKNSLLVYNLRAELKQKNQQLQKVNDELNKFVYSVSHDLRSPLMSILGLVQLSKKEQQSKVTENYFDNIKNCVVKLDTFVVNIIDYYKNSHAEKRNDDIDFKELISHVFDSLKNLDSNVILESDIDQVENFKSDMFRLEVILKNLISNAIKYQNSNNKTPKVNIKVTSTKQEVTIVVSDNGIGIAADYIKNIFNLFFRIGSSSRKEGSGIGLYIVKEAVEKIGATITVQSQPLLGTSFKIVIPFNQISFKRH
ncbi:MAG: hybrid sensor histidine kinase/response regulator [Bacteroidia bacterium]